MFRSWLLIVVAGESEGFISEVLDLCFFFSVGADVFDASSTGGVVLLRFSCFENLVLLLIIGHTSAWSPW